jgi:GWxTD domain-containing protein
MGSAARYHALLNSGKARHKVSKNMSRLQMKPALPLVALFAGSLACGSWQRVGSEPAPSPDAVMPGMLDLSTTYRRMGFLAHGPPVAFVAAVRYLAGPTPDSTLVLFSASLANNTLSLRGTPSGFVSSYRGEARFDEGGTSWAISSAEAVRVGGFVETQRADESVIFQKHLYLPPGRGRVEVTFRDLNTNGYSRDSAVLDVPRFGERPSLSSIVPLYEEKARTSRARAPEFLINPRGTVPFGTDTLLLYVEAYGFSPGVDVRIRGLNESGKELWNTSAQLRGTAELATAVARADPGTLPIGELRVEAALPPGDTARAPVLVSFSDHWVIANLDEVVGVLRYFGHEERLRALKAAPEAERWDLWRQFWKDTDPNPTTPENEALVEYIERVQQANFRFREGSEAGWLTDRGEVLINLGAPDEVFDQSSGFQGARRAVRWGYTTHRLVLDFVDESGFGRYRLTPSSRADYQVALGRLRRQ